MRIKRDIIKLKTLPPLSAVATRILEVVNDENVTLEDLADVLEQSPTLTARILGLANSAYFGRSGEVLTIRDAIIRVLGLNMVKSLALGFALIDSLDISHCRHFKADFYWRSAMYNATLAQHFSPHLRHPNKPQPNEAYTAGLLSNLGILVLVHTYPELMDKAFARADSLHLPASSTIFAELDCAHQQAGAILADKWKLPPSLADTIAYQEDPYYRGEHWPLVMLIGLCSEITRGMMSSNEILTYEDLRIPTLGLTNQVKEDVLAQFQEKETELAETALLISAA